MNLKLPIIKLNFALKRDFCQFNKSNNFKEINGLNLFLQFKQMKTLVLVMLVSTMLFSCKENTVQEKKQSEFYVFKKPVIVDTINAESILANEKWFGKSFSFPVYIGEVKDSVFNSTLNYQTIETNRSKFWGIGRRMYKGPNDSLLNFLIDTGRMFIAYRDYVELSNSKIKFDAIDAIPVFLFNRSYDTLVVGYGTFIPLIREAVDSTGKWREIEDKFTFMCGNGVYDLLLPPNEMVLTFVPRSKGSYKTKIRVRFNKMCSEEYWGDINYSQFESRYDENGNDKEDRK